MKKQLLPFLLLLFIAPIWAMKVFWKKPASIVRKQTTERTAIPTASLVSATPSTVLYVNHAATGDNNGSSWENAYTDLQAALTRASSDNANTYGSIRQIWVAKGTYLPSVVPSDFSSGNGTPNPKNFTFKLLNDVDMYGGFDGSETSILQRNLTNPLNETILSGDVGVPNVATDNARHVLFAFEINENTNIDGFTIKDGYASQGADGAEIFLNPSGSISTNDGGGIYMLRSQPTLTNCIFRNNHADYSGGAIYSYSSSPHILNSKFIGNEALRNTFGEGGAINFEQNRPGSSRVPLLFGALFTDNNAGSEGGAIKNNASLEIFNCTFYQNTAVSNGGGLYNQSFANMPIYNTIFWDNIRTIDNTNSNIYNSFSTPDYRNSIIQGETSTANGNINTTGITTAQIFVDAPNKNFELAPTSVAINSGNNQHVLTGVDLAFLPRVKNTTVDIGAYEYQAGNTTIIGVPNTEGVLYVRKNAIGVGSSWDNAIGELADALIIAKNNPAVEEIWVAGGTYKPMYSPEDGANFGTNQGRKNSFLLVNNVDIYGSFAGDETSKHERKMPVPSEIMSGNNNITFLDGDIGTPLNHNDNVYHVLMSVKLVATTRVNGFAIINGKADGVAPSTVATVSISNLNGGGMFNTEMGQLDISNCVFYNNAAANGGAMYNKDADVRLRNAAFVANQAANGGGLYTDAASSPYIANCTFTANIATVSGAALHDLSPYPFIYNNIIWGNIGASAAQITGDATEINNNIIQSTTASGTNLGNVDPIFVNPGTLDIRLRFDSPAIDQGSTYGYNNTGGSELNDTDLGGRQRLQGTNLDLGAFEGANYPTVVPSAGIVYVDKTATGNMNGSSWANACPELAVALKAAKENTAISQIWVAKGTYKAMYSAEDGTNYGTDQAQANSFSLVNNVAVYGGFASGETSVAQRDLTNPANETILSGDIGTIDDQTDNTCVIIVSAGNNNTAILDGFSITKANANGYIVEINNEAVDFGNGGGIHTVNSNAIFRNLKISNNKSDWYGGGIYNKESSPSFINCEVANNVSRLGAGISNDNSSAIFNYTTIKQNNAENAGGGLFNSGALIPSFINCIILENISPTGAGAANKGTATAFTNCLIYGNLIVDPNSISAGGAAMFNVNNATPKVYNSIVYGNTGATNAADNGIVNMDGVSAADVQYSIVQETTADPSKHNLGSVNPMFLNAAGGDFKLSNSSPAINAGSDALYEAADGDAGNNSLTTDKDFAGIARKDGSTIDIGPYETIVVLPVNLTSFTAKLENNAAVLRWETVSETDNASFELFRSTDGKNFVSLTTVAGKGTTNSKNSYTWHDRNPLHGINYYKLVQKDKDGKTEELGVRPLTFSLNGEEIIFYPNPVREKANVRFTAGIYKNIIVSDINGRIVQSIPLNQNDAEKIISMENLTNGTYFLRLQGDGKKAVLKVIKH